MITISFKGDAENKKSAGCFILISLVVEVLFISSLVKYLLF